jgi:hypothetical protein
VCKLAQKRVHYFFRSCSMLSLSSIPNITMFTLVPILSQTNLVYTLQSCFCRSHFNIIFSLTPNSLDSLFPCCLPTNVLHVPFLCRVCCTSYPSNFPLISSP